MAKQDIQTIIGSSISKDETLLKNFKSIKSCFVGWVESYNATSGTVNVQPAIQDYIPNDEQSGNNYRNSPLLVNVWVCGTFKSTAIEKGDKAVCFVLDQKANDFFKSIYDSGISLGFQTFKPKTSAQKSICDCVCVILGDASFQEVYEAVSAIDTALENKADIDGTYPNMTVGKATNAESATKALQDGNGNVISTTYATVTALGNETSARQSADKSLQNNIDNIVNGTTPAGDSDKLGGEDADSYALKDGTYSTLIAGGNTVVDTRSVNSPPSYYADKETCYEFKSSDTLGLLDYMPNSSYVLLTTKKGWEGSYVVYQEAVSAGNDQSSVTDSVKCYRYGLGKTWGEWQVVAKTSQVVRTDAAQSLTHAQKLQAQNNLGIMISEHKSVVVGTQGWHNLLEISSSANGTCFISQGYNYKQPFIAAFDFSIVVGYSCNITITAAGQGSGNSGIYKLRFAQINGRYYIQLYFPHTMGETFQVAAYADSNVYPIIVLDNTVTDVDSQFISAEIEVKKGINTTGGVYKNGAPVLAVDPTKLTPSTANGWSGGTSTSIPSTAGAYWVKVDNQPITLVAYYVGGDWVSGTTIWYKQA